MDDARKSQIEKRIFAGLLVVFGIGLLSMLKSVWRAPARLPAHSLAGQAGPPVVQTPPRMQEVAASAASQERSPRAELAQSSGAGDRPPIEYTAGDFRDPLVSLLPTPKVESSAADGAAQTPPSETPVAPAVSVEGLFWGGPRPQVLIDGRLYDIGDTVGGSRIVAITGEGVTVVNQSAAFVLQPP